MQATIQNTMQPVKTVSTIISAIAQGVSPDPASPANYPDIAIVAAPEVRRALLKTSIE
jgi:hypothetical protein